MKNKRHLRELILPTLLFIIGIFIPFEDTDFDGTGLYMAHLFFGIGIALFGMLLQTVFLFSFVSTIKARHGFLRNEQRHLNIILKLAAKVIKADGKVDGNELKTIEIALFKEFNKDDAVAYFEEFKTYLETEISLREICLVIRKDFDQSAKAHLMYLLINLVTSDGLLSTIELDVIQKIAKYSRIGPSIYVHAFKSFEFKREQTYRQKSKDSWRHHQSKVSSSQLRKAYALLSVSQDASMDQIKKQYRKLAKIHHPDKVAHLGELHQIKANEKFQLIVDAYDLIKQKRGVE